MGRIPANFHETLKEIAQKLAGQQYSIRGTASLVVQGIDMNVDDIDVIGDEKMALACNDLLKDYLIKPVTYSESEQFKSYFGQFKINNIQVEIMGEWQIKNAKGVWSKSYNASSDQVTTINGITYTTIETELEMFTSMGRWTALQKIKKQLPGSTATLFQDKF